jgi:hypothetical protein
MVTARKDGGSSWTVAAVLFALVVFPVLYVLSSGPLLWLQMHGYVSRSFLGFIYYPLSLVPEQFTWFRQFWGAYLQLWIT